MRGKWRLVAEVANLIMQHGNPGGVTEDTIQHDLEEVRGRTLAQILDTINAVAEDTRRKRVDVCITFNDHASIHDGLLELAITAGEWKPNGHGRYNRQSLDGMRILCLVDGTLGGFVDPGTQGFGWEARLPHGNGSGGGYSSWRGMSETADQAMACADAVFTEKGGRIVCGTAKSDV